MKPDFKLRRAAIGLHGIVLVLFLLFFVYMGLFENVHIEKSENIHTYSTVTDYTMEQAADAQAPAGVRKVYRWTLDTDHVNENCLCFYSSHHYIDVLFDGDLVYSLRSSDGNRIGGSVSSLWCSVPIGAEYAGKEVTVILTPLFDNVVDNDVEFLTGSHYSILLDQVTRNLPQLFLATLCMLLGIFIMAVSVYFTFHAKLSVWNMFFLGNFSALLGLWRITDLQISPLLFYGNPMVLGYISIGMLFLLNTSLLLFISTLFHEKWASPLLMLSCIGSLAALGVLLLQVLGIADFKETLSISHILLITTVCSVPAVILLSKRKQEYELIHRSWKYFLLLAAGIVLDIISFYIHESSSYIVYTLVAFVLYALVMFIDSILDTTQMAYTDSRTGLANKARWNDVFKDDVPAVKGIGIMMLDLNGLKQVNDLLGHEAGDRMIFDFSNILRNTLPSSSLICRWGGDEFTVMITGMTREKLEEQVAALHDAAVVHNAVCDGPSIHFAAGCALSTDYPGLTCKELLAIADSQMYLDKRKWYSVRESGS